MLLDRNAPSCGADLFVQIHLYLVLGLLVQEKYHADSDKREYYTEHNARSTLYYSAEEYPYYNKCDRSQGHTECNNSPGGYLDVLVDLI